MSFHEFWRNRSRGGVTNMVTLILLGGILLALLVLIVLVVLGNKTTPNGTGGERTRPPVKAPPPIGNPGRIKEVAQAGKTYQMLAKGGFAARAEDKDWGFRKVVTLVFAFEFVINRFIESNDGKKIVEVRHFEKVRGSKMLTTVESVTLELGRPGELLLTALDACSPGAKEVVLAVKPVAESLLRSGAQAVADSNTKTFGIVDSLSGKKVRITYVDGKGVTQVAEMGCQLTDSERDFVNKTAVLFDYYAMPDLEITPEKPWTVDASQFMAFLDPSMRGVPEGKVEVVRESDQTVDGKRYATLAVRQGYFKIVSSDASARRIGSFTPRGSLKYNVTDRYAESASLIGDIVIEQVSQDHILFEASFKTRPKLSVEYSCTMR